MERGCREERIEVDDKEYIDFMDYDKI